jgi:uncharacterized membrane protein YcaP (DUF421 family)
VEVCTLYLTIFTEIIGGFFILFIVVKLLGKTQISQITPFDFISALVLGELVGNAIYDQETGFGIILFASSILLQNSLHRSQSSFGLYWKESRR